LLAAGCVGFERPTSAQLQGFPVARANPGWDPTLAPRRTLVRFQMSMDSPWMAGEFEGVLLAEWNMVMPRLRVQFFGDLGPKIVDLAVERDRIVGYFPQSREGVDCLLPRESSRHPLLFIGASLAEEFLEWETTSLVTGIHEEADGAWLRLQPYFRGMEVHRFWSAEHPQVKKRRYWWMLGVHWEEDWISSEECRITAPNLSLRVKILKREDKGLATDPENVKTASQLDLTLPDDIRLVAGSRK
jgi:hypothetical protein